MENGNWSTMFLVCGQSLDPGIIEERLGFRPTAFVRSGEIPRPAGGDRQFDPRLSLDCWKRALSGRQYKQGLAEQLGYWCDLLSPAQSALRHLRSLGHWTVVDCQGYRNPASPVRTLQFRLPVELRRRLERLEIDLEFAISTV